MRTWPITDNEGRVTAFEVSMIRIGLREIERLIRAIPGVSEVSRRPLFTSPSDVHLTFSYRGIACVVWEPFGDNSRYWIGPKEATDRAADVNAIETVFRDYKPSVLKRIGLAK